jgi:hypothetical protein
MPFLSQICFSPILSYLILLSERQSKNTMLMSAYSFYEIGDVYNKMANLQPWLRVNNKEEQQIPSTVLLLPSISKGESSY